MKIPIRKFNKKADISGRKVIFYIIFGFVLVVAFMFVLWLFYSDKSAIADIPVGLENYLLTQRFINSPSCFAVQDKDTERTYPWNIDSEKLTQENIDNCYKAEDTKVKSYRLTFNFGENKIVLAAKNWEGFLNKAETIHLPVNYNGKKQESNIFIETQNAK